MKDFTIWLDEIAAVGYAIILALVDVLLFTAEFLLLALSWFLFDSPITRPLRALIIAYGYVLTGTKVERPLDWGDI